MTLAYTISKARAAVGILDGKRLFGGPIQGCISLTTRCNIRCIHCYYHSPQAQIPGFPAVRGARLKVGGLPCASDVLRYQQTNIDPAMVRRLIDELLSMGTRRFQLSGFGEPFLYPDIMDCIVRIKRSGSSCLANTNGTLLSREILNQLMDSGFDELRVTTMAGTSEGYVQTHPGATEHTFETLKANLAYLSKSKAERRLIRPLLDLVCIVIGPNSRMLKEFTELALELRADRVTFRPFVDIRDPGLAKLLPGTEDSSVLQADLIKIRRDLNSHGVLHNIDQFLMAFSGGLDTRALYRAIPCYQGWISSYINPLGEVTGCCGCSSPLGNIHDQDFVSIWKSAAYELFRHQALNLPRLGLPPDGCDCGNCVHYSLNCTVFRTLHPLRARSRGITSITPVGDPG
jgi:MoaA/NifB/PqqE/SkfB family radical SAM enzyme